MGAAVITNTEKIYTGSNIECASYSLTICAERVTYAKAITDGENNFKAIAIVNNKNEISFPCGACRQFMMEFNSNVKIILAKSLKDYKIYELKDLFPKNFTLNE